MARRIGGAGGGSDKGSGGGAQVIVGTVAAIAIASAGGGIGAGLGASAGSSGGTLAESAAGRSISARKTQGKQSARRGNADEALRRMGLRNVRRSVERDLKCVVNSFGQVREFFLRTPCTSLDRALFAAVDEQGNPVAVLVAWVGFRTRGDARRFRALDDVHGSGNVTPPGGALLGMADVRFTGQHYDSRQAGSMTVIAEAEPIGGPVADEVLDGIAEIAVLLPRP